MVLKSPLFTERLILRQPVSPDTPFLDSLMGDEEVRRFLGGPIPPDRREAIIPSCFLEGDARSVLWIVETKLPLHPIGMVSISIHKDGNDSELSYVFHPDAWGHGYATEATSRALDFAVNDLAFERLIAETQTANSASRRLLERLGMREVRRVQRFGAEQVIYASEGSLKA